MINSASRRFAQIGTSERPTDATIVMRRAVVLGASVAGLMAARVLSDHAEEVLIIERDDSNFSDGPRAGVPQGSHVHGLLPAGLVQLERWFPDFLSEAVAAGGVRPPADAPIRFFTNGVRHTYPPVPQKRDGLLATRPFLESLIRRRTLAIGNIRLIHGRADGLLFGKDRVTGVRYIPSGTDDSGPAEAVTEEADVVVDAMGRSSRLSDWLVEGNWPRPPMQRMGIKINYATALFERDERVSDTWVVVSRDTPGEGRIPRIGGINVVEGNRWIMLVSGFADDRPSRDADDFLNRCRNDFPSVFGTIADGCKMIGSVATYHQADSRRRDFHELDRLPGGLVAVGDAVASFNPIYGQGMTSAALHASCISSYLRSGHSPHEPAHAYFDQVRVIVDAAWQTSTLTDLALPHVDGPYPRGYKVINRVSNKVLQTSMNDPVISHRLGRVATMLAHPSTLARPSTLLRVAWKGAREAANRRAESAQIHVPEARRPAASTDEPSI